VGRHVRRIGSLLLGRAGTHRGRRARADPSTARSEAGAFRVARAPGVAEREPFTDAPDRVADERRTDDGSPHDGTSHDGSSHDSGSHDSRAHHTGTEPRADDPAPTDTVRDRPLSMTWS